MQEKRDAFSNQQVFDGSLVILIIQIWVQIGMKCGRPKWPEPPPDLLSAHLTSLFLLLPLSIPPVPCLSRTVHTFPLPLSLCPHFLSDLLCNSPDTFYSPAESQLSHHILLPLSSLVRLDAATIMGLGAVRRRRGGRTMATSIPPLPPLRTLVLY